MIRRVVVLVGGGVSHLVALRRFAMRPLPGNVRLTFAVPEAEQPHSGLVPAVMAGRATRDAAMKDLAALVQAAGARLVLGEAVAADVTGFGLAGHLRARRPPTPRASPCCSIPQTAGGLMAGVPAARAAACVAALRGAGYLAARIGEAVAGAPGINAQPGR